MGVGVKTGIDTIDEAEGYVPDPDSKFKLKGEKWGVGDSLNTVIGQGDVQVTPIQVARMIAGIANGGTLYQPTLVKQVGEPGQPPTYLAPIVAPSVSMNLSPDVLKGIQQGMCDVAADKQLPGTEKLPGPKEYLGTAHFVFYNWNFNQIGVCGKTGTAQTGAPQPNGWFAAYAGPIDPKSGEIMPEIAIAVIVERSREGSETAGPIVRRIIESYYHMQQEPWPDFWYGAYDPMTDPNASDGGGGAYSNR
jgi:penicillin-binding protein 2